MLLKFLKCRLRKNHHIDQGYMSNMWIMFYLVKYMNLLITRIMWSWWHKIWKDFKKFKLFGWIKLEATFKVVNIWHL